MITEYQAFDAATTPLVPGVSLVEASAGTGKTYALAMLVLRFIVERDIPVDRILVVTFTQAATEELRGRIRERIVEARSALSGAGVEGDATLRQWLAGIKDKDQALTRLVRALLNMDRAPILTIHGFCQRMLREQALDSGQLFDARLLADIRLVEQEVVEDYWRHQLYDLSPDQCAPLLALYPTPTALLAGVKIGGAVWGRIEPAFQSVAEGLTAYAAARQGLGRWWQQHQERLQAVLHEALQNGLFKKPMTDDFPHWWQAMDDFCHGRSPHLPGDLDRLGPVGMLACLNGTKIRSAEKRLALLAGWSLPETEIAACGAAIKALGLALRGNLAQALRAQVTQGLLRRNRLSFDDLITLLAEALVGPRGPQLQRLIGARFQAALIDEFQDTDHRQYQIFSTLFGSTSHFLYLIGDPKQAIYRFRGADIHAYYRAWESAGCLLGLDHNYRSHPALVAAVNSLFAPHLLPFHPVAPARTRAETGLSCGGRDLLALACCQLPPDSLDKKGRWSSGRARDRIIASLVQEIRALLDSGCPVVSGEGTRLGARDIAILVRNNHQGQACYEALLRAGIPAVLTSRRSVFASDECRELALVLRALCAPGDPEILKTAMTCSWFGLSGDRLQNIWQEGDGGESWLERFQGYGQCWHELGFLVMMGRLLAGERVFEHLARLEWAERRITNINHLLELVHATIEEEGLAPAQVLQWLIQLIDGDGTSPEKSELRLESDEQALRIVTLHAAKGLQYSVVFCPFLWYRGRFAPPQALVCEGPDGGRILDLGSPVFDERLQQQAEDDGAEEMRLVYVALTRAISRCYLYWADVRPGRTVADARTTALAQLLGLADQEDGQAQELRLQELSAKLSGEFRLLDLEVEQVLVPAPETAEDQEEIVALGCRTCHRSDLESGWRLHSYSSLAHFTFHDPDEPEPVQLTSESGGVADLTGEKEPEATLPAGPGFGNLIHGLLEENSFAQLAAGGLSEARLLEFCGRYQQDVELSPLRRLLVRTTTTPLLESGIMGAGVPVESFMLSQLAERDCLREMPFTLHLRAGSTARLNGLLADQPTVRPVAPQDLRGYLTGFIDLVCRWQGRYYLIDYKSNRLGAGMASYASEHLAKAMREHNYGLQYWLYSLVLHKYLAQTLVDYAPERHFGGVCYLFVRGMDSAVPGSGVYFDRPDPSLLDRLHQVMTGGGA